MFGLYRIMPMRIRNETKRKSNLLKLNFYASTALRRVAATQPSHARLAGWLFQHVVTLSRYQDVGQFVCIDIMKLVFITRQN